MPIKIKKSDVISIVLQLENSGKGFNSLDEIIIQTLCNEVSFRLDFDKQHNKLLNWKERCNSFIAVMISLLSATSQYELTKAVSECLPKFHTFEDVQILFYNEKKNQLYTVYNNILLNKGENMQIITFPLGIGISGDIVEKQQIRIKDLNTSRLYNADVDNISGKKYIHNYLYAPLFDNSGNLNAIIQFLNKCNKEEVNDKDIEVFKSMEKVYGLLVEKVKEKESIMNIVLGLKSVAEVITGKSADNSNNEESESQIDNLMNSMLCANNIIKTRLESDLESRLKKSSSIKLS